MRRGRMLSLCLVLALCLSLLPVTALAAALENQVIYVGGVEISSTDYWTTDGEGNVTAYTGEGTPTDNYIHYDADTNTLTLHNATIKKGLDYSEGIQGGTYIPGSAIGVLNLNGDAELTITLAGTNTIEDVSTGIFVLAHSSYTGDASLTITGSGSLTASGKINGINVQSNSGDATLTIQSADVTLTSNSGNGVTVQAGSTNSSGEHTITLSVEGGSLTASGSTGISFDSASSNTVSATNLTVSNNAIVRANDVGSNISNVDLQIGKGNNSSGGIVFDGNQGTVYGSVELQDNLTIDDDENLTIGEDASLTIPNNITLTNEGTVTNSGTLTNNGTINNSGTLPDDIQGTAPPRITTTSLAGGTVGTAYTATLAANNSPSEWSVTSGSLPVGLNLNGTTGEISGTPTTQGTSNFTVTASNAYGSDSKEFTLTINPAPVLVNSVTLNKSETTLTVGGTDTLTATITPDNTTNKNVTWSSDKPEVAKVENGIVTAVSAGTATITATAADGSGEFATCAVTVTAPYIPPVPSYLIQLPEVEGGTVTADLAAARQGTEVTLTVTPDEGFALASLAVTDFFGNQVDVSRNSDGTYSFVMPASQVTVSAAFAPAQLPFTDVTEANWYYDEVYYVWANGLMQGTSAATFGPNVDTTRAMVVTILWRLEGEPASGYDMDYSDVAGGAWYAGAVRWATEHGIVNGSEGQFYPGGIVTREQLAAMLYRYAQYKGYDLTAGGDLSGFADAGAVSGWAETSLAWAVGQGLIQGSANQIDPTGSAIRAQLAAILMRFCENLAA